MCKRASVWYVIVFGRERGRERERKRERERGESWLTIIQLMSHELSSSIVVGHGEAGAVWLHVAIGSVVPLQSCQLHQTSHIHQTIHSQPSLLELHAHK